MKRRTFLKRAGAGTAALGGLAGCTALTGNGGTSGTLQIATYDSFTGEGTAGAWLKEHFESEYPDATVEFSTPSSGINEFIQRTRQGAPIDADMYIGLNTGELVRVDRELEEELFADISGSIEGESSIKSDLHIDPERRALPYDTGYISLVYDEEEVDEPADFEALLTDPYEDALITQNAQQSDPGRAFLLWSIITQGEENYLEYWENLLDNGVTIISDWGPAYEAYMNEEAPMVVSYSTDQVYYHGDGVDMSRHQVGFLNDQGYANPEAMAIFAESDSQALAQTFAEYMLTPEAQSAIATRNVQFPAVDDVDVGGDFGEYALEPPQPVTFTYDELAGNVSTWIDDWARTVASA